MWEDPAESETHIDWTSEFMQAMEPFTLPGISLNFTSDQTEEKVKASFGSERKYDRLVALKYKYDPTNMFRLNQNIKPTAQSSAVSSSLRRPSQGSNGDLKGRPGAGATESGVQAEVHPARRLRGRREHQAAQGAL